MLLCVELVDLCCSYFFFSSRRRHTRCALVMEFRRVLFRSAELTDQLKLTVGVRYTEDKQRYNGCSRDFNGNMLPNVNVVNRALYFQTYGVLAPEIAEGQCNTFDPETGTFGEVQSDRKSTRLNSSN